MSPPSTPPSFPGALPAAFEELRAAVEARAAGGWLAVLEALAPETRALVAPDPARFVPSEPVDDAAWVASLDAAEERVGDGHGALARAVGAARADALLRELAARFEGDPLGFLRAEASGFYRGRANYGAASVELAAKRVTLRLVASTAWLKRGDGRRSVAPLVALGFFDRAIERLAGVEHRGRYVGRARRADALGGIPLWNLLFEYPLEDE